MTFVPTIVTFASTWIFLLLLIPLAKRFNFLDQPGGHKTHSSSTPMIGGVGIYLGLVIAYILSPALAEYFYPVLVLGGLILLIGIIDDLADLNPIHRLLAHACVAFAMIESTGVKLENFGDILFLGPIELGILSVPMTVFAVVGVINAVNMSDGVDGLSSGLVVITLSFVAIANIFDGAGPLFYVTTLIAISVLAFWLLNFRLIWNRKALIFLGDSGSNLLGFLVAWLLINATNGESAFAAPVYALWFFALPLMDTVSLLIRRPLLGRSPFKPGHDHLHHRLLEKGFTPKQVILIIYSKAIAIGSVGLAGYLSGAPEGAMFFAFILLFILKWFESNALSKKIDSKA